MAPLIAPTVTALYGGVLGLLALVLAALVVRNRVRHRVQIGDAGNAEMQRAMRVFANFTEYVPIALLLIGFGEMLASPRWLLHVLGAALVVARVLHAYGLSRHSGESFGRMTGTIGTWLTLLVASIAAIVLAVGR